MQSRKYDKIVYENFWSIVGYQKILLKKLRLLPLNSLSFCKVICQKITISMTMNNKWNNWFFNLFRDIF